MSSTPDITPPTDPRLGLMQATNERGAVVARLAVTHWPVTVGRALVADLVLDDAHVAAAHLRIDRTADGGVAVSVLDTLNGVHIPGVSSESGSQHFAGGQEFDWSANAAFKRSLRLGDLQLELRLAEDPLPAEQLWQAPVAVLDERVSPSRRSRFAAAPGFWTALAVLGVLLLAGASGWLEVTEPNQFEKQLPGLLGVTLLSLLVWSGVWALATKLFMGRLQFWRHVRIASAGFLATETVVAAANVLAFSMSLESLARFEVQLSMLCLAVVVYWHLAVTAPQRTRFLAWLVASLAALGLVASLGTTWLQTQRLSDRLYMTHVYPPSWRLAKGVGIDQFMGETAGLKQKLDVRLKDRSADGDSDPAND